MATALQAEEKLSQILQCPICLESFTRPKVLPCGHTYCASCLQLHINTNVTHSKATQACFPCPVCKTDAMLADPNICIEQWAESFPVNSIACALIDATGRTKEDDNCSQCIKQGKESFATYFCTDCDQTMCISCKKYHDGFPSLSRHDVRSVCDKADSLVKPGLSAIEMCPQHCSERIKLFCKDHNTLCCSLCATLAHQKCEHVVTIEDMLESFDVWKKSKEIKLNMVKFEDHINKLSPMLKANLDKLQKDKDTIIANIKALKSQVIAKLQELEGSIIQSLESEYKSENSNLQNQEIKGRSLITAIKNDQIQLDLVMTHGSAVQKVISLHNLYDNQTRCSRAISDYLHEIKDVNIRFEVDEKLSEFVNAISELAKINFSGKRVDVSLTCLQTAKTLFQPHSTNLPISGHLNERKAVTCLQTAKKLFQPHSTNLPISSHLNERKAVKLSEFDVSTSRDQSKCYISSILILKDKGLLLVDNANDKVKLFGQDYTCQASIKFEVSPWSACSLSATEVAVTIPDEMTIQIIEIDDVMRKKREIETRFECWGIAVVNDQLVLTTNGHIILILDMHGREIKAVHTKHFHSDKYLDPDFIKADTNNSVFYVSYNTAHKFVAYSMNWDFLFAYTDQGSAGIDVDREGNIYFCGYDTHSVLQISAEGKLIKTLISKKKERMKPLSITFYKDKDIFLLTYENSDIVEVYELCVSHK